MTTRASEDKARFTNVIKDIKQLLNNENNKTI